MNANRRTILSAALWSAPTITVSSATPAYASSHQPDHECKPDRCKPKVTRRRCTKAERKKYGKDYAYEVERVCPFSWTSTAPNYGDWREDVDVPWAPYPGPGKPKKFRVDRIKAEPKGR